MPDLSCPKCRSENTQRLEIIYSSGVGIGTSQGTVVAASIGSNGNLIPTFGVTETKSQTISALAQRYAPPSAKGVTEMNGIVDNIRLARGGLPLLIVICGVVGLPYVPLLSFFGLGLAVFVYFWLDDALKKNLIGLSRKEAEHHLEILQWMEDFACLRCGHTFSPVIVSYQYDEDFYELPEEVWGTNR